MLPFDTTSKKLNEGTSYYPKMWRTIHDAVGVPNIACEIGTRFGFWTRGLLRHVGVGHRIYCVDIWPWKRNFTFYARAWQHILGEDAFTRAVLLRGKSDEWATALDVELDLLYIDGDHSYEQAKRDIENWWPKLRHGGIMLIHDTDRPPVAKAMDEFFNEQPEVVNEDQLGSKRAHLTRWTIKE